MRGKRIVPLKYDAWSEYTVMERGAFQPLWGFAAIKLDSSREAQLRRLASSEQCTVCGSLIETQHHEHFKDTAEKGTII